MRLGRMEVLVEPFKENAPGPHVVAVLEALEAHHVDIDMGPFATVVEGDLETLIGLATELVKVGFDAGATSIQTRIEAR